MDFGKALIAAQDLKGVRSAQLAEQLGVSRQQIHKWRTKKDARLSLVVKFSKELDIDVMEFLELANASNS
jgi:transcriptional regulator with XRE-family HTH domain|tara:strand:+ start:3064 stop:3273 length:210 start_codon:yes stop_codon:yes gene_type:complete